MAETLVTVSNVSKKFCRNLKRSLWYGVQDIASELVGGKSANNQLRKDEFWAVKNVSFELRRGECLGLIGHNGAGKSTLLKMLNGLIKPDQGKIVMRGRIGALIELGAGFNPILSGRENVYVNGQVLGLTKREIDAKFKDIVDFSEIGEFIDAPVKSYSSGMKVRLGFAVAAQMEPDILIVDEVLAVGDIGFRIKCLNVIQQIKKKASIILVSHTMQQISRICNRGILMNKGEIALMTHDIGLLTESYTTQFESGEMGVSGSGAATISDVRLLSEDNSVINSVRHGERMSICFDLAIDNSYDRFCLRIIIFNLEQRPIIDYYSRLSEELFENKGSMNVTIRLPALALNAGKYSISIVVLGEDERSVLCRIDNAASFYVKSDYHSYAENYQSAEWIFE